MMMMMASTMTLLRAFDPQKQPFDVTQDAPAKTLVISDDGTFATDHTMAPGMKGERSNRLLPSLRALAMAALAYCILKPLIGPPPLRGSFLTGFSFFSPVFARGGATRGPLHPLRGCPRAWALDVDPQF